MNAFDIFYRQLIELEGYKNVLTGLKNTALIAVFGLLIGMFLGCVLATCKILPKTNPAVKVLSGIVDVYIAIFRGTPMVVQLLLIHFVIFPACGFDVPSVIEAILVFGLNSAAYVSEIIRGGISSIDRGQMEAARSLGLGYWQSMREIILPQAIKNVLPALENEFIVLLKETSVSGYIALADLTKGGDIIRSQTYDAFLPLIAVALIYLAVVMLLSYLLGILEKRLKRNE